MFGFKKKVIEVPVSNDVHEVQVVQLWYVKWTRRYDYDALYGESCVEAFPVEQDALDFAESLRNARALLRDTDTISKRWMTVTVVKN